MGRDMARKSIGKPEPRYTEMFLNSSVRSKFAMIRKAVHMDLNAIQTTTPMAPACTIAPVKAQDKSVFMSFGVISL